MTRKQLLARLKVQVAFANKHEGISVPDVLCSKQDILDITGTGNLFSAADVLFNDKEVSAILQCPDGRCLVLPDDDGLRVYKDMSMQKHVV